MKMNVLRLGLILAMMAGVGSVWGQTNPTAHSLSASNYSFNGFANGNIVAYPSSMQGWKFSSEPTSSSVGNADGDRVLADNSTTITTGSIRNEIANGISFLNSSSNNIGAIVVAINSTDRQDILLSWTAEQLTAGGSGATDRINGLQLQYRIGTTGNFTTIANTAYLTTNTTSSNSAQNFTDIPLPSECNNQSIVQVRWIYYINSGSSNSRDRIRLDDLLISSVAIPSCSAPSTQAHTFTSSNIQTTQMDIGWMRGNGDNVLVVARAGSAVNADPVSGTSYAANAAFGSGDQIGSGNYVVYNGTGTGLTVTGLTHSTTYHFAVYEYNNTGVCYNLTELAGNVTTASPPSAITHTGTAQAAANIVQSSANNVLYRIQTGTSDAAATLTEVVASTGGTWQSGDISNFKLWFSTDATFGGDATIATINSPSTGDQTFTVSNQSFPIGTRYLFITCDVAGAAVTGRTVSAYVDADGDFTYSTAPTYSGSSFAAAENMTIVGIPEIQLEVPVGNEINCGAAAQSFGSVHIGSSGSITVRIKNIGTADLTLNNLPLSLGGSHPGDYSITTQPTTPITPGNSSDMVVQFSPTTTGTRTANITIANNDGNEGSCVVSFTGTGLLANDNCSGAVSLTVSGTQTCGGSTSGTTVGATNSGVSAILCNGFTGTADDDVWYSFVATNANHTITVVGAGSLDAVVDLRSGACNGTNIACADATGSAGTEVINATGLTVGATYLVRVYGYGNGSGFGSFTICVTTPAPPYHFRTKQSGDWSSASTWEISEDNITWTDAGAAPIASDLSVTVHDNHSITISTNTTIDQLVLASGTTLEVSSATLTIADGTGTDLIVQGTLKNTLGTITATGTIEMQNGGVYQHNYTNTYGTIPTATWSTGSTCEVIGYTNPTSGSFPSGINQAFSNFTWNTPSLSTNPNLSGSTITVTGTFTLISTGSAEIRLGTNSDGTINTSNYSQSGGTINFSAGSGNGKLNISGNFNQSGGTITESSSGSGTIEFNGTNQMLSKTGGAINNTIHFRINSAIGVTLNNDFNTNAGTTLTFTSGLLTLGANNLTVSGSISGASSTRYIVTNGTGALQMSVGAGATKDFPIGASTGSYDPVSATPTNATTIGARVQSSFTVAPPIPDKAVGKEWDITSSSPSSTSLSFTPSDPIATTSPVIGHYVAGSWEELSATRSGNTWTATTTSFSPFGVGDATAFPIELLSFSAKPLASSIRLDWATASEQNNDYMAVEKSAEGLRWEEIGRVAGAGTTTLPQSYTLTDDKPLPGLNYYRLRQVDFDGRFEYHKTIVVDFKGGQSGGLYLFPSPAQDRLHVNLPAPASQDGVLWLLDVQGRVLQRQTVAQGGTQAVFEVATLPEGIYFVRMEGDARSFRFVR